MPASFPFSSAVRRIPGWLLAFRMRWRAGPHPLLPFGVVEVVVERVSAFVEAEVFGAEEQFFPLPVGQGEPHAVVGGVFGGEVGCFPVFVFGSLVSAVATGVVALCLIVGSTVFDGGAVAYCCSCLSCWLACFSMFSMWNWA